MVETSSRNIVYFLLKIGLERMTHPENGLDENDEQRMKFRQLVHS